MAVILDGKTKKYNISLTDDELKELKSVMRKSKQPKLFETDARLSLI